jgi:hypothetical protein
MWLFSTNTLWILNASLTDLGHTSYSAVTHTELCMDHQQNSATLHIQHLHWIMHGSPAEFSHTSHSALTLDYAWITNRIQPHFTFSTYTRLWMYHQQHSATLHIQHLHWIMHRSPTEFSHTSHSALTLDYARITNRIQPHFTFSTNALDYECITNRIQPHITFSTWAGLCMDHQQNSATLHIQH